MSKGNITNFVQYYNKSYNNKYDSGGTIAAWEEMLIDGLIPNVDVKDSTWHNITALMYQAIHGTYESMEWLLTREPPANPDIQDEYGNTALIYAVICGNPVKVQLLLDYGADRSITSNGGTTALSCTTINGIIGLLVSYYPEKKDPVIERGRLNKGLGGLKYMSVRERTTSKFVKNNTISSTVDTVAVWEEMLRDDKIPNVNVLDITDFNRTALMYQALHGTKEGMEWLLTREPPANSDMQNNDGYTALMYSVFNNNPAKVRLLLEYRANRSIKNKDWETALSIAKRANKDSAIIALLENYYPEKTRMELVAFNRSRIFTVGLGGEGKTSLNLSLRGLPPQDNVPSTVGVEAFSFDVSEAGVMDGGGDGGGERVDWGQVPSEDFDASVRAVAKAGKQSLEEIRERRREEIDIKYKTKTNSEASNNSGNKSTTATNTTTPTDTYINAISDKIGRSNLKQSGVPVKSHFFDDSIDSERNSSLVLGRGSMINAIDNNDDDDDDDDKFGSRGRFGVMRFARKVLNIPVKKEVPSVDTTSVVKCLSDKIQTKSKFIISLYDFGGQIVFDVIHPFFMTRFGVYTLVFNMASLLSKDESVNKICIEGIKFWLDSIAVHTLSEVDSNISQLLTSAASGGIRGGGSGDGNGGGVGSMKTVRTAPVAIVGTRKDMVNDPRDHVKVSKILEENFSSHIAFRSVIPNSSSDRGSASMASSSILSSFPILTFFPVNNNLGRKDPTILDLMSAIEKEIDSSDYVHERKPLSWLQTFDMLKSLKKAFFDYEEVVEISRTFGVASSDTPTMLSLFHDMGMLMWHEEPSLRNIVIMDPVSFFVFPSTNIICQHEPTFVNGIERSHYRPIHGEASRLLPEDYKALKRSGFMSDELMQLLLSECGEHRSSVLNLMMKYGLVCRILTKTDALTVYDDRNTIISNKVGDDKTNIAVKAAYLKKYLVPTLLPAVPKGFDVNRNRANSNSNSNVNSSFYFLFSSSNSLITQQSISWKDVETLGFLPRGFFDRLVCRAVSWSQITLFEYSEIRISDLFKDMAMLRYGRQNFRMTCLGNCIKVDVEGRNPIGIYCLLLKQIKVLIIECMKSLQCIPALLVQSSSSSSSSSSSFSTSDSFGCLVPIPEATKTYDFIKKVAKNDYVVEICDTDNNKQLISGSDIKAQHPEWFGNMGLLPSYDVFISHRWGMLDDKLVESMYDRLTIYPVGSSNRAIDTFLDTRRLQNGRSFLADFAKALVSSTMIVPILSRHALERMVGKVYDSTYEDNVLIEWIMALECYKSAPYPNKRVKGIFPILLGSHKVEKIADLLSEKDSIIKRLSSDVPVASLEVARQLLEDNNVPFDRRRMDKYTVKGIVGDLLKMLGCKAWEVKYEHLTYEVSEQVKNCLLGFIDSNEAHSISSCSNTPPASNSFKDVSDKIVAALGLDSSLNVVQIIDESSKRLCIGGKVNALSSGRDKLDTIAIEIDILKAMSDKIVKELRLDPSLGLSISAVIEKSTSALGIAIAEGATMREQLETIIAFVV